MSHTPRAFASPRELNVRFTLDDMELYEHVNSDLGAWCRKVLLVERNKTLDSLGATQYLPRGVLEKTDDEDMVLVSSLVNHKGELWAGENWVAPDEPVDLDGTCDLDEAEVAFVARALLEGADSVLFHAPLPLAIIAAPSTATKKEPAAVNDPPKGSSIVAIVDGLDRSAVLELLAIAPGPKVYRRSDGAWVEDNGWVEILSSVDPPPMVKLDEGEMLSSVVKQVDDATKDEEFIPFKNSRDRPRYMTSSASYLQDLEQETYEALIASNLALVAVAGRNVSPKDMKNTEQLRRYWLYGKGAAKIRWGTPGAWRRCYRNVVKYMGPKMAPGYCTNLSKRLGGPGVATHVGSKK